MTTNSLQRHLILDIQGQNIPVKLGVKREVVRELIVRNRSDRTLSVDLWVEPNDTRSAPIQQWCQFDQTLPQLRPRQDIRVMLRFEIPPQTPAGFYSYDVCAQTPDFPEETERRPQQLEILPSEQEVALRNEPIFRLDPPTDSDHPYPLTPGTSYSVQLTIENHSKRVDRFFVTCPDLPLDWFDVMYPEATPDQPGQAVQSNGLQLNPEGVGTLTLQLHPPALTAAGHYSTTLRLTSTNQTHLALLDMLYFSIQVDDTISTDIMPKTGHIPGSDSEFVVTLNNQGNIQRDLTVTVADGDRIFVYTVHPNPVQLKPGQREHLYIVPTTKKWWRRQWKKRQDIQFQVAVQDTPTDTQDWNDSADSVLTIPKTLNGTILWESYPTWLRWLLKGLLLALLLTVGAILARYALKWFVVDPRLQPRVLALTTPKEDYVLRGQNPIQLDFEISNINKVGPSGDEADSNAPPAHALQFVFLERESGLQFETDPTVVDRAWLLSQRCTEDVRSFGPFVGLSHALVYPRQSYQPRVLSCQRLIIPEGCLVVSGPSADGVATQDNIPPCPQAPIPQALPLEGDRPQTNLAQYQAAAVSIGNLAETGNGVVDSTSQNTTLGLFGSGTYEVEVKLLKPLEQEAIPQRSWIQTLPLVGVLFTPASARNAAAESAATMAQAGPDGSGGGDTGQAQTHQRRSPGHIKQLKNIQLAATPAAISYFYSKASTYRDRGALVIASAPTVATDVEHSAATDAPVDSDQGVVPSDLGERRAIISSGSTPTTADVSAQFPAAPIKLNWIIDYPWNVETLELSYVLVRADGEIMPPLAPQKYRVDNGRVMGLNSDCQLQASTEKLICSDVSTGALVPGEYRFTLKATMTERSGQEAIMVETEPITIRDPYPEIVSFMVNGQDALEHPQQVHLINPARGAVEVTVAWEVKNPDQVTMALSPAPGPVTPEMSPMLFSLPPGNNRLTFQVSNAAGEVAEQSVVVSVNDAPTPTPRPTAPLPVTPLPLPSVQVPGSPIPLPPTPTELQPGRLSEPLQVPPSGN